MEGASFFFMMSDCSDLADRPPFFLLIWRGMIGVTALVVVGQGVGIGRGKAGGGQRRLHTLAPHPSDRSIDWPAIPRFLV